MRRFIAVLVMSAFALIGCSDDQKKASNVTNRTSSRDDQNKQSPVNIDETPEESGENSAPDQCSSGVNCEGDPFAGVDIEEVEAARTSAEELTSSLNRSIPIEPTSEEKACLTASLLQKFPLDQAQQLSEIEPGEPASKEQITGIGAAYDECVRKELISPLFEQQFSGKLSESVSSCMLPKILEKFNYTLLLLPALAPGTPEAKQALEDQYSLGFDAGFECSSGGPSGQ